MGGILMAFRGDAFPFTLSLFPGENGGGGGGEDVIVFRPLG